MKIRTRLVLYFLLLAIVPLTFVNVIVLFRSEESIEEQAVASARASLKQINNNLDVYMSDLLSIAKVIVLDRSIQQWIRQSDRLPSADAKQLEKMYGDELSVRYFLNAQKGSRPYIQGIYLLSVGTEEDVTLSAGTDYDLDTALFSGRDWWRRAVSQGERMFIEPHHADYYRSRTNQELSVNLLYPIERGDLRKWVMVRMDAEVMRREIENGIGYPGQKVGLFNQNGSLLLGEEIEGNESKEAVVIRQTSEVTGWTLVARIPYDQLFESSRDMRNMIFTMTVIASLLGLLLALTLSHHVLKPLRLLGNAIRTTLKGQFHNRVPILSNDEIGDLSISYNQMLDTLEALMKQVVEEERAKKDAEMKALQYQINPHFLYNTLNSVQWLAVMKGVPEIKELVASLIRLLQSSLGKKGPFQTVAEELEDVRNYVRIQQYRFGEDLHIEFQVDPEAQSCKVPRLILQPLVENSIFHGFEDGKGHIWIEVKRDDGKLLISITDDGAGMSEEQLARLMERDDAFSGKYSGIGIRHVAEKIERLYGPPYGIQILSEIGQGTKVIIRLPFQEEDHHVESRDR
jgi:Predicted signal transduction protein with a C-terminal ATPase domain